MEIEMRITGKKRKKTLPYLNSRVKFVYVYPTPYGEMTLDEMSDWTEKNLGTRIPAQTIRTRVGRYQQGDRRVFSTEPLPKSHHFGDEFTAKDIRHKCKRNRVLCRSYHDCQSSRLGMVGYPKWVEPEDTDACFVPEMPPRMVAYGSGLSHGAISMNLLAR